jgi:hypothetical protein
MSEHMLPERSMAVMALAADDPERRDAQQHAAHCPQCRALLDEAQTLLDWVDAYAPLPAVDPALKARVRNVVLGGQVPLQRVVPKWVLALGMLLSLALAWFEGEPGGFSPLLGLKCLLFENAIAVAPSALTAYLGVRGRIALQPLNLAAVSMAAALVGQLTLLVHCEAKATPHLLAFHALGVALAAALGYAATSGLARLPRA